MDIIAIFVNLLLIIVVLALVVLLIRKAPGDAELKSIVEWIAYVIAVLYFLAVILGGAPPLMHPSMLHWR
jgi:hypothetical protein